MIILLGDLDGVGNTLFLAVFFIIFASGVPQCIRGIIVPIVLIDVVVAEDEEDRIFGRKRELDCCPRRSFYGQRTVILTHTRL